MLIAGIVVLVMGLGAIGLVASQLSSFSQGFPPIAVWKTVGGVVLILAGCGATFVTGRVFNR